MLTFEGYASTTKNEPRLIVIYDNQAPAIMSAGDSPDPLTIGQVVNFTVGWSDSSGDAVRAVICKTNAVSAGSCPGGSWAIGSLSSSSPSSASYATQSLDSGINTYYAFACDQSNACSSSISGTFAVNNYAPVARLTISPSQGDLTTTFTANMSGSYDPDGDAVTYEIDWGDGTVTPASSGSHRYQSEGDYVVTGSVTDSKQATSSASQNVRVCAVLASANCVNTGLNPQETVEDVEGAGPSLAPLGMLMRLVPDLDRTPRNRVLILDANVLQSYASPGFLAEYRADCMRGDATNICDAPGRRARFADRVKELSRKASGLDGMGGYVPDILLLQEANLAQADSIAEHLTRKLGWNFDVAVARKRVNVPDTEEATTYCSERHPLNQQACLENIRIRADSAILYNAQTMTHLRNARLDLKYDPDERCEHPAGVFVDTNRDGDDDCRFALWKRNYFAGFAEKKTSAPGSTGFRVALASVHPVTKGHFFDERLDRTRKNEWAQEISDKLLTDFPPGVFDVHSIGGDWNIHRCENNDPSTGRDYPETSACIQQPWWTTLNSQEYRDTIYERHKAEDDRLHPQYRWGKNSDGTWNYANKRIDFLFTRRASLIDSSFDLTCGLRGSSLSGAAIAPNCDNFRNSEYYSDHRLLWSLVTTG
jgi:hypothetical protein